MAGHRTHRWEEVFYVGQEEIPEPQEDAGTSQEEKTQGK